MTITPFRQAIRPNQSGSDILAVKRAMKRMGAEDSRRIRLNKRAGAAFVHTLKCIQHNHGLAIDGVYGPKAHAIIARHFDAFGVYLYKHAKIRTSATYGGYVNPFHLAKISLSRTDMGVDFHGTGPIVALGDSVYIGNSGHGWPGGHYMLFKLLNGIHAGRYYYYAEAIEPVISSGQHVKAGDVVCRFGYYAAPGRFPGIEVGWSTSTLNLTWAAVTHGGYYEGKRTEPGKAFARLLRVLGCPTLENPGPGSTFV